MRDHVRAAGAPVHELVPLGADLQHFTPGGAAPSATDLPLRLVHVGGLNRVKDQELLLRMFALVLAAEPAVRLTIAGGDTLDGHHRRLATQLGVAGQVDFLGHVPHEQLPGVVRGAALHVLTSRHDAGPVAVLEAAACGVPTVGTDVGHVHDFAGLPSPAAVAVTTPTPQALADATLTLLRDDGRRHALAASALTWAQVHDATHTARTFEMLYRRLVARSARA
jgi:glycosyltransferase involved in cell wall biosynthesis